MAAFACVYAQRRPAALTRPATLRPSLQVAAVCVAWVTSLSRVADRVHHVGDVLVGAAIGLIAAVWAVVLAEQLLKTRRDDQHEARDSCLPLEQREENGRRRISAE